MSEKDEIDTSGIAALFGMPKTNCASVVDHVDGFPAPIRLDRTRRVYSLKQVKAWAKTQKHPAEFTGTKHDALSDAIHQAKYVSKAFELIRDRKA